MNSIININFTFLRLRKVLNKSLIFLIYRKIFIQKFPNIHNILYWRSVCMPHFPSYHDWNIALERYKSTCKNDNFSLLFVKSCFLKSALIDFVWSLTSPIRPWQQFDKQHIFSFIMHPPEGQCWGCICIFRHFWLLQVPAG